METIYERQELIKDLQIPKTASVIGCGGTGFWTALLLAMSGVEELILVDSDSINASNLNRLPLKYEQIGQKKIEALHDIISNIRSNIRIEVHDIKITTAQDCQILRGIIFCCTDNLKSQQQICAYAKKNNLPYQRIGYDGTILNVSNAFPLSFDDTPDGYTVTPSWVVPAVLAAASGISSATYKKISLTEDIGKLHMQDSSFVCQYILDKATKEGEKNILNNIHDHIPDDYGYCSDCSHCEDCDRIDPDNDDYGYCPDCTRPDEEEVSDIKEKAKEEGMDEEYDGLVKYMETGEGDIPNFKIALDKYYERRKQDDLKRE